MEESLNGFFKIGTSKKNTKSTEKLAKESTFDKDVNWLPATSLK